MKRKMLWIATLFAALALIVTGCPTGGGGEPEKGTDEPVNIQDVFSATEQSQEKATVTIDANGSVTMTVSGNELWGELVTVAAGWDVSGFTGLKLEYKSTGGATVFIQDSDFNETGNTGSLFIFGINGSDGWGALASADDWTPLELPFSILQRLTWFGADHTFGTLKVIKLCFQIQDSIPNKKFEIRNLTLYGKGYTPPPPPPPPPPAGEPITVFGEGALGTGVSIVANEKGITHTVSGGKIVVNRDAANNEFRLQVGINPAIDISGASDFVLEFDIDGGTSLSGANISIYTSDSKKIGIAGWNKSSPASYNFVNDHQSWLGVALSVTNGLCTGFEIYSDSEGNVFSISSVKFE